MPTKRFFCRLFSIYPGEEKNAFLFALLGFLWSFAVTLGDWFAETLFLSYVGAKPLPYVYATEATLMIATAFLLLRCIGRHLASNIFLTLILTTFTFYLFSLGCFYADWGTKSHWLWYAMRILSSVFFMVGITCYWNYIDQYHHIQVAKRLYSLFCTAIFLGVTTTGTVLRSNLFNFQGIICTIVITLLLTSLLIKKIAKSKTTVDDEERTGAAEDSQNLSLRPLFQAIFQSPFVLLLVLCSFLTYLLQTITEYHYFSYFDTLFNLQERETASAPLTLFLGQWVSIISFANLLFGLFAYSRIIKRFGFGGLVLATPLLLLASFLGSFFSSAMLFPLLGFFAVEGTVYILDDNNLNLLLNAAPTRFKYKIRVAIQTFFEPIGTLCSAFLLVFLPHNSKFFGLLLSSFLLILAIALNTHYIKAMGKNLSRKARRLSCNLRETFYKMSRRKRKQLLQKLFNQLKEKNPSAQLLAFKNILSLRNSSQMKKAIAIANQFSTETKLLCLPHIEASIFAKDPLVIYTLKNWCEKEKLLKEEVMLFLAKKNQLDPERMHAKIQSSSLSEVACAIITLNHSYPNLSHSVQLYYHNIAKAKQQQLLKSQDIPSLCTALFTLGEGFRETTFELLISYLRHPSYEVRVTAGQALEKSPPKVCKKQTQALLTLIPSLSQPALRQSCLKALGKVGAPVCLEQLLALTPLLCSTERHLLKEAISTMGDQIVPLLLKVVKESQRPLSIRLIAGTLIAHFTPELLEKEFYSFLLPEIQTVYHSYYHLHTLDKNERKLLQEHLTHTFTSRLDFIVQLLGCCTELKECEWMTEVIKNGSQKSWDQLLEVVSKVCPSKLLKLLYPIIARLSPDEVIRIYQKQWKQPQSLYELLIQMEHSPSDNERETAALVKKQLQIPSSPLSTPLTLETA